MPKRTLSVQISGGDTSLWIGRSAVAEGRGKSGRARLVVESRAAIVDRRVYRDRPHGGRVSVAVAVVVLASVTRRPHVDGAEAVATLVDALHDRLHGRVARTVHCLAVVRRTPGCRVDVDLVRLVAH